MGEGRMGRSDFAKLLVSTLPRIGMGLYPRAVEAGRCF